jgi:hypothetical protein
LVGILVNRKPSWEYKLVSWVKFAGIYSYCLGYGGTRTLRGAGVFFFPEIFSLYTSNLRAFILIGAKGAKYAYQPKIQIQRLYAVV